MVPDLDCLFVFGAAAKFHPRRALFSFLRPKINHLILGEVKVEDLRGLESIINTVPAMLPGTNRSLSDPSLKQLLSQTADTVSAPPIGLPESILKPNQRN